MTAAGISTGIVAAPDDSDVRESLASLQVVIEEKRKRPNLAPLFDPDNFVRVVDFDSKINAVGKLVKSLVQNELESIGTQSSDAIAERIKASHYNKVLLDFNLKKNSVISNSRSENRSIYQRSTNLLESVESEISKLRNERFVEVSKLNSESKHINHFLNLFGISHFTIQREDRVADNISVQYAGSPSVKKGLKHTLSEGEKTALALAYFFSKLQVEQKDAATLAECTIVIDDPISSLDENRLYQTACLIESFFFEDEANSPKQLFVMSHNIQFLKFLSNCLRGNLAIRDSVNGYFMSPDGKGIRQLPLTLRNFTSSYLLKLSDVFRFSRGDLSYEEAKNYLPNGIRVVLETFLSFKLACVTDGEMLPGLSTLIAKMIAELKSYGDVSMRIGGNEVTTPNVIRKLTELKKLTDSESHGGIGRIEDVIFVSEAELKNYSRTLLQVISFLDTIHFSRAKSLAS